uniref:Vacuolar protein 8 n=1 Tax=Phaeomonas parva TaxID=124430 RepID=A0A6U4H5C6_9STRA|mmetsp:Transcript_3223/g.9321  ORF Transcript_3223/g.9321 Transcript_3223/m.9321 type:complete len:1781 (+) Transcript_3223:532-5874(+)|eukprot:CAMPEP_0118852026 /NCGR_PEP_ID=MMETSP1163-20130328/1222_1 /TAXON_ID=124430 /ORGANISM="Phaeomonas parva, Strain CCMP2877" /LENGTH=1780 /DNA_ID=CAMNT_0006784425 /DNA_START=121 /DNA_END=5463 /DNA_ORIENTATION=+
MDKIDLLIKADNARPSTEGGVPKSQDVTPLHSIGIFPSLETTVFAAFQTKKLARKMGRNVRMKPIFSSNLMRRSSLILEQSRELQGNIPDGAPSFASKKDKDKPKPRQQSIAVSPSSNSRELDLENATPFQRLKASGVLYAKSGKEEEDDDHSVSSRTYDDPSDSSDMSVANRLAMTIRNWAQKPENAEVLIKEEGIRALVSLSSSSSTRVQQNCASAMYRLSCFPDFRHPMIEQGAVASLSSMVSAGTSTTAVFYTLGAIANFSKHWGLEDRIVHDGAVVMILKVLASTRNEDVRSLSIQVLFNLTCVEGVYGVIERVIKALITVHHAQGQSSGQDSGSVVRGDKRIISGLCNCSNLSQLHLKLIEEGAIQVLIGLTAPGNSGNPAIDMDKEMKYICVGCLYNMATARASRAELVVKGGMKVLANVANETDPKIVLFLAGTLHKLSMDRSSRFRLLGAQVGVLDILRKIIFETRCRNIRTLRSCAAILRTLSDYEGECVLEMVNRGCIELIVTLSNVNGDVLAKQLCAATFCNILLLDVPSAHRKMFDGGGVQALNDLCSVITALDIKYHMAMALYKLSREESFHRELCETGTVANLRVICEKTSNEMVREVCAAAICQLVANTNNLPALQEARAVPLLVELLQCNHIGLKVQCCAALAIFATYRECTEELMANQVVEHMVNIYDEATGDSHGAGGVAADAGDDKKGDPRLTRACASMFSRLSLYPEALQKLKEMRNIHKIISMANADDMDTRKKCATALCNLSCEADLREHMVDAGVTDAIKILCDSYSEETQSDCVKCLFNLSCSVETRAKMMEQGVVHTLLMTALVRAVNPDTKQLCSRTLLHLISAESMSFLLKEGVLQAFGSLSMENHEETLAVCARAFCVFSCQERGRRAIVSNKARMTSFFTLMRANDRETRINCGKAVCNLLIYEDSQKQAAKGGGLAVLKVLATADSPTCEVSCAHAITALSDDVDCRTVLIRQNASNILVLLTQSEHDETVLAAASAICCLSFHARIRPSLVAAGVVSAIAYLVGNKRYLGSIAEDCARTMCYLAATANNRPQMAEEKAVLSICMLCYACKGDSLIEALCALALRHFSWSEQCLSYIVEEGGVELLTELVRSGHDSTNSRDLEVAKDAIYVFSNLSERPSEREHLAEAGVIETMIMMADSGEVQEDTNISWRLIMAMRNLSNVERFRAELIDAGVVRTLVTLSPGVNDAALDLVAGALCNLSKCPAKKDAVVAEGAVPVLIRISDCDRPSTRHLCSVALVNLSGHSVIEQGTLEALFSMSTPRTAKATNSTSAFTRKRALKKKQAMQNMLKFGVFKNVQKNEAGNVVINRETRRGQTPGPGGPHAPLGEHGAGVVLSSALQSMPDRKSSIAADAASVSILDGDDMTKRINDLAEKNSSGGAATSESFATRGGASIDSPGEQASLFANEQDHKEYYMKLVSHMKEQQDVPVETGSRAVTSRDKRGTAVIYPLAKLMKKNAAFGNTLANITERDQVSIRFDKNLNDINIEEAIEKFVTGPGKFVIRVRGSLRSSMNAFNAVKGLRAKSDKGGKMGALSVALAKKLKHGQAVMRAGGSTDEAEEEDVGSAGSASPSISSHNSEASGFPLQAHPEEPDEEADTLADTVSKLTAGGVEDRPFTAPSQLAPVSKSKRGRRKRRGRRQQSPVLPFHRSLALMAKRQGYQQGAYDIDPVKLSEAFAFEVNDTIDDDISTYLSSLNNGSSVFNGSKGASGTGLSPPGAGRARTVAGKSRPKKGGQAARRPMTAATGAR